MSWKTVADSLALGFSLCASAMLLAQGPAPQSALDDAARAFEQGNIAEAQQKIALILKTHPAEVGALLLQGVLLDSQQHYPEAERYYQRALAAAPNSPQVLNNLGNHHMATGNRDRARAFYLKTIAADPRHGNANLQLARLSVEDGQGRQALQYLGRLGASGNNDPSVLLLRARALGLTGQCSEATELARRLGDAASSDVRLQFPIGMVFASCKVYDQAEQAFTLALAADPRDFDILYNLGLAALRAGHAGRAAEVFGIALEERPEDADCLFAMSQVQIKQERPVNAAALLTRAHKLAPGRADIVLLLAQVSAQLKFYEDSAAAYDRYLKLKPTDEIARRERGFALARANQTRRALPDLESYVLRHPRDATGLYELGSALFYEDRKRALALLDRALAIDSKLIEARYTRAELYLEEARPEAAIADLRVVLDARPGNYYGLVRLGQAYLALNRPGEALEVLKPALDLAPNAPAALIQYRNALEKLGRKQEAEALLPRLQQAGTASDRPEARSGLLDYLSLPPSGQRAQYLANLRANSASNPGDPRWKLMLGSELLSDGKVAEALAVLRELRPATSDPATLARAGRILLEFEQYEPAHSFLEAAMAGGPASSDTRLDLATALFHLKSSDAALAELDKTPVADRQGDYYLLRAQILDALGKGPEAVDSLNRGMRASPTKASLYFQAAGFLLKHRLYKDALALLEPASRILPDARELLLAQAVTLIHLMRTDEAERLLTVMQARWPEWERPYLLNGILQELRANSEEARRLLETAIALGSTSPEAYYYHALAISHSAPDDLRGAQNAISRALELAPQDAYINLLAGKIALSRQDYPAAIQRLLEAVRLRRTLVAAHYSLVAAYRGAGDEKKAAFEVQELERLSREKPEPDQRPLENDFLFTVVPAASN